MHVGIAQAHFRDPVQSRRGDHAAEGRGRAITHVIGDDQKHVRRAFGRGDARLPERGRLQRVAGDRAAKGRIRRGKLQAVDHPRRCRRAGRGSRLLGNGIARNAKHQPRRNEQALRDRVEEIHLHPPS